MRLKTLILTLVAVLFLSSCDWLLEPSVTDTNDQTDTGTVSIDRSFWGTWVRMDTGQEYFFTGSTLTRSGTPVSLSSADSHSVSAGSTTYELVSENVIRAGDIRLFREGGATRDFTARVAGFQDTLAASGFLNASSGEAIPQQGHVLGRRGREVPEDEEEVATDSSGIAAFEDSVADTTQILTTEYETSSGTTHEISAEVQPQYDGEFVGTIPLVESGHNFKVTYDVADTYLYGNGYDSYPVTNER